MAKIERPYNIIKELRDFYLVDDKLLYACKYFIGFNPTISKSFSYETEKESGTKVKIEEFEMNGCSFSVILTRFRDSGPIRGFKRVEIILKGKTIIRYETGGKGRGNNYSDGNKFLVDKENAYLIADGYSMKYLHADNIYLNLVGHDYYFLWFHNIIIPTINDIFPAESFVVKKEFYLRKEIEPLRQTEWEANVQFNNHKIHIIKTSIPGFTLTYGRMEEEGGYYEEFRKKANDTALSKVELIIDGQNAGEQSLKIFDNYYTYKNNKYLCKNCGWTGMGIETEQGDFFKDGFEIDCPKCHERLKELIIFPSYEEVLKKGSDKEKQETTIRIKERKKYLASLLKSITQLPELNDDFMAFVLREVEEDGQQYIVITHENKIIWKEIRTYEYYDRFIELGKLFEEKYGDKMIDLVPDVDGLYLYGDRMHSPTLVKNFRKELRKKNLNK